LICGVEVVASGRFKTLELGLVTVLRELGGEVETAGFPMIPAFTSTDEASCICPTDIA
jgi:hypothetical protein